MPRPLAEMTIGALPDTAATAGWIVRAVHREATGLRSADPYSSGGIRMGEDGCGQPRDASGIADRVDLDDLVAADGEGHEGEGASAGHRGLRWSGLGGRG